MRTSPRGVKGSAKEFTRVRSRSRLGGIYGEILYYKPGF